jgi:signal transduction histidine kinase
MGNYEAVLKTNKAALIIAKKMNDKFLMANCYGNIGTAYSQLDQYSESLKNQIISLKISEELADKNGAASTLLSIGWLYQIQGNYTEALKNHFASLKLYEELENKEGKALIFGNIGHIYSKQKKHQEAMRYLDQSLLISKELKMIDNIRYTYGEMVALDSAQGHFETAFEHYKLFIEARDSLVNENKIKEITQQQMQYEFDKKQLADSLNFERDKEIGAIKLQKQKAYTFGGLVGLAIAIILLFLVYTNFNKQRIANQKLKDAQQQLIQIEREKEAENIRLRISRDIHDDIGHSLTKISLLSDMTANDKQINSPEAVETLGRISNYSRNVNSSLSEIVWAISPKHDSLDSLIVYMRNHIHTFFENTGITYQINFPEANENRSINPDLKRNIFLVLKESLNNILKYAKAKNVTVDFKIDGNQFELKIKDDGVGFSPLFLGLACASREELGLPAGQAGLRSGGNGLPNMKHRIEQTGGSFEINSSVGNGCEILAKGQLI